MRTTFYSFCFGPAGPDASILIVCANDPVEGYRIAFGWEKERAPGTEPVLERALQQGRPGGGWFPIDIPRLLKLVRNQEAT